MQIWIETFVKRPADFNSHQCLIRLVRCAERWPWLDWTNLK